MQRKGLSMGCLIAKFKLCNSIPPNGEAISRGGLFVKVVQNSLLIFVLPRLNFHICKMDIIVKS